MYKILLSSPCNSRLEQAHPDQICSSSLCYLSATWSSKSHLNLSSLCAHLNCPLKACVLRWLLLLDPRGTEWPAKIKTWSPTPLIESHTLNFRRAFTSWSLNPKANLSDHAELKWIYSAAPRTCRFRVIEVGVRCFFEHIPVFLAFPTARQDPAFHRHHCLPAVSVTTSTHSTIPLPFCSNTDQWEWQYFVIEELEAVPYCTAAPLLHRCHSLAAVTATSTHSTMSTAVLVQYRPTQMTYTSLLKS